MSLTVARLPENTPFYAKIASGNTYRVVPVTLVSRSFEGSPSAMTEEDSVVLAPVDGGENIVVVRHAKNPNLVLQVATEEEVTPATDTTPAVMETKLKPSSRRVTFLEINDETKKQKEMSDAFEKAAEEEAVAAERRRTLAAQMTGDRAPRTRTGSSGVSTADLIERAKGKVTTYAKRKDTLTADLKKTSDRLDESINALKGMGVTVTITDGVPTFEAAEVADASADSEDGTEA